MDDIMLKHSENKNMFESPATLSNASIGTEYVRGPFLGKGSFATCYILKDLSNRRSYAAKILEKKLLDHPVLSEFVTGELSIHRLVKHKNIVTFYGAFEDDIFIYILLELCKNKTLLELQKRREYITLHEAKYYLNGIIDGVSYLHEKKIVHGDLKLSNIFISNSMQVKIGDFGLATVTSFEKDKIQGQCGTPNYMAPEIVQMKGRSFAGDIWAIGCILYGLLVGQLPFQSHENSLSNAVLFHKIKNCDYSIYRPGLRKLASSFIKKILQKNPDDRPTITDLKNDKFMLGFIPTSLPEYTLWEPPLPRDLISGMVHFTKESTIYGKPYKSTKNLKQRMKPSRKNPYRTRPIPAM